MGEMGEMVLFEGGKLAAMMIYWWQIRRGYPTSLSGRQSYVQHIPPVGVITLSNRWGQFRG